MNSFKQTYKSKQFRDDIFDEKLNFMIVTRNKKNVFKNRNDFDFFSNFFYNVDFIDAKKIDIFKFIIISIHHFFRYSKNKILDRMKKKTYFSNRNEKKNIRIFEQ